MVGGRGVVSPTPLEGMCQRQLLLSVGYSEDPQGSRCQKPRILGKTTESLKAQVVSVCFSDIFLMTNPCLLALGGLVSQLPTSLLLALYTPWWCPDIPLSILPFKKNSNNVMLPVFPHMGGTSHTLLKESLPALKSAFVQQAFSVLVWMKASGHEKWASLCQS